MPTLGTIALADGKGVPVTHTFSPVTSNGQKARLDNRAATIPRGFENLIIEVLQPGSATAAHRVLVSFVLPTVASVNGIDTVVRTNKCDFALNFSQDSTEADRKDARVMLANLFLNATMVTVIEKLEPLY